MATIGMLSVLLVGCRTPNEPSCGPFPDNYESIVRNCVTPTFKHPDRLEWRTISFPRKGSLWRGLVRGGADPCWLVDVTVDERNGSGGFVAYQKTIYIKNNHVTGVRAFHPEDQRFISVSRTVSFAEMSKWPPFSATVQSVQIDHPFFISKTADVQLKRTDNGKLLVLKFGSPDEAALAFVRSLHLGQKYVFPQAFDDYVASLSRRAK